MIKPQTSTKEKFCYLCINNIQDIDYKEPQLLRRFMSSYAKIASKKRSGVCAWHQRKVARAIKRARILGLLPFVVK